MNRFQTLLSTATCAPTSWSPGLHPAHPPAFRDAVRTALLCCARHASSAQLPLLPPGCLHAVVERAAHPLSPWRDMSLAAAAAEEAVGMMGLGSPLDAVMPEGGLDMDALAMSLPR